MNALKGCDQIVSYRIGDDVQLVPTQGGYQETIVGRIIGETRTEWRVKVGSSARPIRFRKANGTPVERIDQGFPHYCMKAPI